MQQLQLGLCYNSPPHFPKPPLCQGVMTPVAPSTAAVGFQVPISIQMPTLRPGLPWCSRMGPLLQGKEVSLPSITRALEGLCLPTTLLPLAWGWEVGQSGCSGVTHLYL